MEWSPEYGVFQGGVMVASAACDDQQRAWNEAMHYARVYRQDGPVEIREIGSGARALHSWKLV